MTIHYRLEVEGDLLRVKVWGTDEDLESVKAYGLAVIEAATKHSCYRVLTDERDLVYEIGTVDLYELVEFYTKHGGRQVKAAVVCNPRDVADASFWETVSTNRGLIFRAFTDVAAAERWLGIREEGNNQLEP